MMRVLTIPYSNSLILQLLIIISFTFNNPFLSIGVIIFFVTELARNPIFKGKEHIENAIYLFIYCSCICFGLFFNSITHPLTVFHSILAFLMFTSAILFIKDLSKYEKHSKYLLIVTQVIVIFTVFQVGFTNFPAQNPLEGLIEGSSSNAIPTMLIVLQVNYFIAKYFSKKEVPIISCILTLIIALIGYGRGSILAAFLILVLAFFCLILKKDVKKLFLISLPVMAGLIIIIFSYMEEITLFINVNTKLSAGMVDYHRQKILVSYLSNLNIFTIFTGAEYPDFVKYIYNSNPHNSFIRAHHFFGIFYVLFIILIPLLTISKLNKFKDRIIVSCLLIVIFFRSASEPVLFPTIFDFYFFASFYVVPKLYLSRNQKSHINI